MCLCYEPFIRITVYIHSRPFAKPSRPMTRALSVTCAARGLGI